jgi:hypothetical protein
LSDFIHPETGEILATEESWRAALARVEEQLAPIYRTRRALREAYADRFPAPEMPARTARTETQEKVVRCPRCGLKYSQSEEPPEDGSRGTLTRDRKGG